MQYKTMILEMLRQRPRLHRRLKARHAMQETIDLYATELKTNHLALIKSLSQERATIDSSQLSSEALEIAIKDMQERIVSDDSIR